MASILLIDDESSIRRTLKEILTFEKYEVIEACDGIEALETVSKRKFDVILLDIKMPRMDGIEAFEKINELAPDTPVIMISGHANIDTAVDAVKKGAFDFISKPPDLNRLLITIRNAIDKNCLVQTTKVLQHKVSKCKMPEMIGNSPAIAKIHETIDRVAPTEARVLITGGNGTGKELVAKLIHAKSNRKNNPLIEVNCAAIPSELIESELFGHEKGAFTSAVKQRIGKFEQASGATLFLDEIGDMSLEAQAKVLRALQEKRITRVGGEKDIHVDVRVIAATNKDLLKEIEAKRFREDLYHRLAVIIIRVPSLSERLSDIRILGDYFINIICCEYGIPAKVITTEAYTVLEKYNWTGNIRELRNVIERLIILSGEKITADDVVNFVQTDPHRKSKKVTDLFEQFPNIEEVHKYIESAYTDFKEHQIE
ncbi:MAG: sigma-54 dependent transcriptional regulator [Bacteroidetes bacterium]|jgi:two-component system nitrogen regulation response regulator NtrX|nr:sigma-54 dependent transcriptional regulator [Bacteroidota bacterium]HMT76461.1 sigma-54 dependent transcriptional regulator [Saprospiraceae bacterium]